MAYEDKVAAQVRTLDEATGSLWHLHKALVATRRQLQGHRPHLQRHVPRSKSPQTDDRRGISGESQERHTEYRRCLGDIRLPGL
jgi:hypothetical protein